jgi:hypothetical protein
MEQSPLEANSHSASQEIPHLSCSPIVSYRVHTCPPLVPILSQMHLVHIFPPYFLKSILLLTSHLRLGLPSGLFPSGFPTTFWASLLQYAILFELPT